MPNQRWGASGVFPNSTIAKQSIIHAVSSCTGIVEPTLSKANEGPFPGTIVTFEVTSGKLPSLGEICVLTIEGSANPGKEMSCVSDWFRSRLSVDNSMLILLREPNRFVFTLQRLL